MLRIVQKSVKISKKTDDCITVFFALLVGQLSLSLSPPPPIYISVLRLIGPIVLLFYCRPPYF